MLKTVVLLIHLCDKKALDHPGPKPPVPPHPQEKDEAQINPFQLLEDGLQQEF